MLVLLLVMSITLAANGAFNHILLADLTEKERSQPSDIWSFQHTRNTQTQSQTDLYDFLFKMTRVCHRSEIL